MANPRYQQQPQDPKLQKLAILAQLLPALQRPQMEQSQQDQALLLGLLGLGQQSDSQEAQMSERRADRESEASFRQSSLDHSAQQHKMTLDASAADSKAKLAAQASNNEAESRMRMLSILGTMPGTTPSSLMNYAGQLGDPQAMQVADAMKAGVTQQNVQQVQSQLGPAYASFDKNPTTAQAALDMIWSSNASLQDPAVQTAIQPWLEQQNQALYKPTAPTVPMNIPGDLQGQVNEIGAQNAQAMALRQQQQAAEQEKRQREAALLYIMQNSNRPNDFAPSFNF